MKRCGEGCEGCKRKCAEQGRDDCTNCAANKRNKDSKNPCFYRQQCLKEKPKAQSTKDHKDKPKLLNPKDLTTPMRNKEEVKPENFDEDVKEGGDVLKEVTKIEERDLESKKRKNEGTGTPEENKKQFPASGIPTKKMQGVKDNTAK